MLLKYILVRHYGSLPPPKNNPVFPHKSGLLKTQDPLPSLQKKSFENFFSFLNNVFIPS